jgi:DNA-binding IclR family transcriptional regulator
MVKDESRQMTGQEGVVDGPIVRCVRMIRLLAETETDISIKDAAQHLGLPASTTHRLLRVLLHEGLVAKDPTTSRYRSGLELERLGSLLAFKKGFRDITRPHLQRVADHCGEACMFVAYLPATHQVSIMAAVNSLHPLRYEIELYVPHSVVWGATGRSIFAFLPEEEQRAIAEKAESSPGTGTPLPPWKGLKAELDAIRERGFVVTQGQKLKGAVGIGAPIRNSAGNVIGSFCITVPEIRFDPSKEESLGHLLMTEAASFSNSVGRTID